MEQIMNEFISYDGLPLKSGGAHSVNNLLPIELYNSLIDFTESLTTTKKPFYIILEFNVSEYDDGSKMSLYWILLKKYGIPGWSFSQYTASKQHIWTWKINKSRVNEAIEIISQFSNLTLSIMWRFKFIDALTKDILPGQQQIPVIDQRKYNSQIYLRIGKRLTLSLWLTLPFNEQLTQCDVKYLKIMQKKLPVKLSNNSWQVWKLNRNGKWIAHKLNTEGIYIPY